MNKENQQIKFVPIWFDSLGAKSACSLVKTCDIGLIIDPDSASLQPSYPMPAELKNYYQKLARKSITNALQEAEHVVISHYHYDHHYLDPILYKNKKLWIKDPNQWINKSQWERSRLFLEELASFFEGEVSFKNGPKKSFADPLDSLTQATSKDFGHYQERRNELLKKWRKRFLKAREYWKNNPWVDEDELQFEDMEINFAEGRELEFGQTHVRFTKPLFHGIEYANTGWVFSTVVEVGGEKFIHTSDLQGPTLEDYAQWIIEEDPDYLILDGPATYLFGYMLNRTNLNRSLNNAYKIVRQCDPKVMIYDHHLLRDKRYRKLTHKVWDISENVITAAKFLKTKPLINRTVKWEKENIMDEKLLQAREGKLDKNLIYR